MGSVRVPTRTSVSTRKAAWAGSSGGWSCALQSFIGVGNQLQIIVKTSSNPELASRLGMTGVLPIGGEYRIETDDRGKFPSRQTRGFVHTP
jgi:hypothetical protein